MQVGLEAAHSVGCAVMRYAAAGTAEAGQTEGARQAAMRQFHMQECQE